MGWKDVIGLGVDEKTQKMRDEAPQFEKTSLFADSGMKKLTFYAITLLFTSMGTGWDG